MFEGDRLPILRAICYVSTQSIVNVQFAALLQDENSHRRELFADRANTKHRLWRIGRVRLLAGNTIALAEDHTIVGQQHGPVETPTSGKLAQIGINTRSIWQ